MLKINPLKTIALATALTVGTIGAAQNRLQNAQKELLVGEFRKADNNPQDYYITQDELNAYMGNDSTNVNTYDQNEDGKLNIDEFTNIGSQEKNIQNIKPKQETNTKELILQNQENRLMSKQPLSTHQVDKKSEQQASCLKPIWEYDVPFYLRKPVLKNMPAPKTFVRKIPSPAEKEGYRIFQSIKNANNSISLRNAINQVNENNLEQVVNQLDGRNYYKTPNGLYSLIRHKNYDYEFESTGHSSDDYCYNRLYNVLCSMLKKRGLGLPAKSFLAGQKLDRMYYMMYPEAQPRINLGSNFHW